MPIQSIEIKGLADALKHLDKSLIAKPLQNFYQRSTLAIVAKAKPNVPVDAGLMRSRLTNEIDSAEVPQWGKAGFLEAREGTEAWYAARAMEFGTGRVGDPEVSHKSGHFPPPGALDLWAARHGFASGFIVARIIARRGGLLPRRMLREGLRDSVSSIQGFVSVLADDIKALWDHH